MNASYISGEENTIEGQTLSETELYFLISRPVLPQAREKFG